MVTFKNAIGYIRVSTERQADDDKYGIEVQKQAILLYANDNGYNIVDWKVDEISGTKDAVDAVSAKLNVLATENIGKFKVAYIYDKRIAAFNNIDVEDLSLQDLFIKFAECGGEENE